MSRSSIDDSRYGEAGGAGGCEVVISIPIESTGFVRSETDADLGLADPYPAGRAARASRGSDLRPGVMAIRPSTRPTPTVKPSASAARSVAKLQAMLERSWPWRRDASRPTRATSIFIASGPGDTSSVAWAQSLRRRA